MTVSIFVAALLAFLFLWLLRKYAVQLGLLDVPVGRKAHEAATPVVGGLGMFLAFLPSAFFVDGALQYAPLFFGIALLVAVGVLDDLYDLTPRTRFLVQILAALFMVSWGGVCWNQLGNIFAFGQVALGSWAIPFTVFAVVGVINAYNMIDGVDGLAGGLAFVSLLLMGVLASLAGLSVQSGLLLLMAVVVLVFLGFNARSPWRKRASLFMGDAGSMMLGFMLIWFAVELSSRSENLLSPITMIWILAVPILDTLSTMFRRMLKGKSPFSADREHLHHIFLRSGYTVSETVFFIVLSSLLFALVGVAGWYYQVPDYVMTYTFLLLFVVHFLLMHHAWRFTKVFKKMNRRRHLFKLFGNVSRTKNIR